MQNVAIEHTLPEVMEDRICGLCIKARVIDTARYARKTLGPLATAMTYNELLHYGQQHYKSRVKCYNCLMESENGNNECV